MRVFSSSVMAALVVVALFWGNCFSCPQALLALASHQRAHQCCHKTKAAADCGTQNLHQYVKADSGTHAPVLPVVAVAAPAAPPVVTKTIAPAPLDSPPPEFIPLHPILRV
jgi:hypothetical protein